MDWIPKTKLGRDVLSGKVTNIDDIFKAGLKINEPEIVDMLLPNLRAELIMIGGSPGKGGGIKRTTTKRTARMHRSGRRYRISAVVVVGDENGHIGVGKSAGVEHKQAIDKATTDAKLGIIPVRRGCGSWECGCSQEHSIPFEVKGRRGSIEIVLKPAPKGIGLCVSDEHKKVLRLAGVKDIWSKSFGNSRTRSNMTYALLDAFKRLNSMKAGNPGFVPDDESRKPETEPDEIAEEEPEELEEEAPKKKTIRKKTHTTDEENDEEEQGEQHS